MKEVQCKVEEKYFNTECFLIKIVFISKVFTKVEDKKAIKKRKDMKLLGQVIICRENLVIYVGPKNEFINKSIMKVNS